MEFRVEWEAVLNGEKMSGIESEASYFLVDQLGKMYSYGPMKPILPIDKRYTKCVPLFVVGDETIPFEEIERRLLLAKELARRYSAVVEAAVEKAWPLLKQEYELRHENTECGGDEIMEGLDMLKIRLRKSLFDLDK